MLPKQPNDKKKREQEIYISFWANKKHMKHGTISNNYLEQIEDLHTELVVKVPITWVGHVIDKYESVSLRLDTKSRQITNF